MPTATPADPGDPLTPSRVTDPPAYDPPADDTPDGSPFGAAGGFDLQGLLAQAQQMQQQLAQTQADLADARIVGTSGGGLVTATVSGTGELVDLVIDPDAVDPEDSDLADTLADLVLAAVRDAATNAAERAQESFGPLTQGLGGLPGMPGSPGPAGG